MLTTRPALRRQPRSTQPRALAQCRSRNTKNALASSWWNVDALSACNRMSNFTHNVCTSQCSPMRALGPAGCGEKCLECMPARAERQQHV
eukprot:1272234-Pleurochrysis_carterae.AAC.2